MLNTLATFQKIASIQGKADSQTDGRHVDDNCLQQAWVRAKRTIQLIQRKANPSADKKYVLGRMRKIARLMQETLPVTHT